MTPTDTGVLVALLDMRDPKHVLCLNAAKKLPSGPLLTTWPCFTEAIYLLGKTGSYRFQERLWSLSSSGRLQIMEISKVEADRMHALMRQYQNVPMDLADASLIATMESRGENKIFTIDSDFYIYRLANNFALEVVP